MLPTSWLRHFGQGVAEDYRRRRSFYVDDWREGLNSGLRIFGPATYVFFASVIPALAFGEQIDKATDGALNGVHVLASTAIYGIFQARSIQLATMALTSGGVQAIVGGQPLLIAGIAQPVVIVYIFMYDFLKDQNKLDLFLPWTAWTCLWAGSFMAVMALMNVCSFVDKFTRFSGELFGMLIGVLFMQQAIVGLVDEFNVDNGHQIDPTDTTFNASTYSWRIVNGLWSLILALGLLSSSLLMDGARSWRFGKGWLRANLADYGVPIMIALWTGISYALRNVPENIPRRLNIANTWDDGRSWKSALDMGDVDGWLIGASVIPGIIIAVLYYFDHNVSSKMAQQKEYNLKKPPAYHYDFLLLAMMTVLCGLLGLPPANVGIPQSPMHMKSLASLKKRLRKRDTRREEKSMKTMRSMPDLSNYKKEEAKNATLSNEHEPKLQREITIIETPDIENFKSSSPSSSSKEQTTETISAVEVKEQRLSNLIQSILVALSLCITPILQQIPKSLLWGYFAYMAIVNLPGSEFFDRILLILTDKKRKVRLLGKPHAAYLETVPMSTISRFTYLQIVLLLIVWGITFAGFFGILFPIVIMLVIPARQYVMPRVFDREHLYELDTAEYEQVDPIEPEEAANTEHMGGLLHEEDMRERLDQEIIGTTVKYHVTREEIKKRRASLQEKNDFEVPEIQVHDC